MPSAVINIHAEVTINELFYSPISKTLASTCDQACWFESYCRNGTS